jgi:hypothetical protein
MSATEMTAKPTREQSNRLIHLLDRDLGRGQIPTLF